MGIINLIIIWIVGVVWLIAWVYGKLSGNDFGTSQHQIFSISVSHATGFSGPQNYHQEYYYSSCANAEFLEAKLLYQKMGWQVVKKDEDSVYFQNPEKASNVVCVGYYSGKTYLDSIPYKACKLSSLNIIDYKGYNVYMWEDYVPRIKKQYKTFEEAIIRMGDERLRLEITISILKK